MPDADDLIDVRRHRRLAGRRRQRPAGERRELQGDDREAFNGKALAIVQSTEDDGPITINASSAGLTPAAATVWAVEDHPKNTVAGRPIGVDPVHNRTPVGITPVLPDEVVVVQADGSTRLAAVNWQNLKHTTVKPGTTTVKGTIRGLGTNATAVITAYEPIGVDVWSTTVPAGMTPTLPPTVRVAYSDGVDQHLPVTWETVPASAYDTPGTITLDGAVEGLELPATAEIEVTDDFAPGQNLAAAAGQLEPIRRRQLLGSQQHPSQSSCSMGQPAAEVGRTSSTRPPPR